MDQIANGPGGHPLQQIADRLGVQSRFHDIWGKDHQASEEVQKALLRSMGVDTTSPASLERALEQAMAEEWTPLLPSTLVLSQSDPTFPVSIARDDANGTGRAVLTCEDGTRMQWEISLRPLAALTEHEVNGRTYLRKKIELPGDGGRIPLGYHHLHLTVGHKSATAHFIVCPDQAYQPEWLQRDLGAGIAVSLYGVRSERNWGCGDTRDLGELIDWVAEEVGASFVALNPLHAIPNRQPYNTSPYLPNSTFYRNPIYLDVEGIEDFALCPRARALVSGQWAQKEIRALRLAEYVEYERVNRLKIGVLKLLFRRFLVQEYRQKTARAAEFQRYVEREGDLLDLFAVHSALDDAMHKANRNVWNWPAWPPEYRAPNSAQTRAFAREHWRGVLFHKYAQWQLDRQFSEAQRHAKAKGLRIGLYHDLALATDRFGSDLWAHRQFYIGGCRVGSPPDQFSPKGQDWSFPPPNSRRHFEDGYRLFAESIRKASAHGGALRIDHVMRLFRLYWIPDGSVDATEGTYVRDRHEDLVRVLALESVRGKFIVIGEDLGTVPDNMRETLHRFRILSYRLLYFEQDASGRFYRPEEYPRQALVSATTHDLPTLAGFWEHSDIEARRGAGIIAGERQYLDAIQERLREKAKILALLLQLDLLPTGFPADVRETPKLTGEIHNAIVGFLARTPCELFILNQEDLFKETDQQNLPGTTVGHPNWRHKMRFTVEDLHGKATEGYTRMVRGWLERTGRLNGT